MYVQTVYVSSGIVGIEQRPPSRDLCILVQLFTFLRPYRNAVLGAMAALLVAAAK